MKTLMSKQACIGLAVGAGAGFAFGYFNKKCCKWTALLVGAGLGLAMGMYLKYRADNKVVVEKEVKTEETTK